MNKRTEYLLDNIPLIRAIGRRMGVRLNEMDDFVQDVFLASIRYKYDFNPERASIATYSCGLVERIAKRAWVKRRVKFYELLGNEVYKFPGPDLETLSTGFIAETEETGKPLTDKQMEVCKLILAGVKKSDIARRLGITRQTVSQHAKYIRLKYEGKVRKWVKSKGGEKEDETEAKEATESKRGARPC